MNRALQDQLNTNLAALEVVANDNSGAAAAGDHTALAGYGNWGALAPVFDEGKSEHESTRQQLIGLLGDDTYTHIKDSILDSYYTPAWLSDAIWRGIAALGFDGGSVLEPAAGNGNLMVVPEALANRVRWTAIEACEATSKVLQARFPDAKVINSEFQATSLAYHQYDLAVLNPPFGSQSCDDHFDSDLTWLNIHSLFLAKSARCVRPGGLMVALVSHWYLDAEASRGRELVAKHADLVRAIRLPSGMFMGTDVVSDLLFFRVREERALAGDDLWLNTGHFGPVGDAGIEVNAWYIEHPDMVLGQMAIESDRFGKPALAVTAHDDTEKAVQGPCRTLPRVFKADVIIHETEYDPSIVVEDEDRTLVYGYAIDTDGNPVQRGHDNENERRYRRIDLPAPKLARLVGLLGIRDVLKDLIRAERIEPRGANRPEELRVELNARYHAFVKRFGPIHGVGNARFRDDPDFGLLMSLEMDFEPAVTKARADKEGTEPCEAQWAPADILTRRVLEPDAPPNDPTSPEEALIQSIRRFGRVDIAWMAAALEIGPQALKSDLFGRIYQDPASGEWVLSEQYLSGDVRKKLAIARKAAESDPHFAINVAALEQVLPKDIPASDIIASLGSPWIPGWVLRDFIKHMIDVDLNTDPVMAAGNWYIDLQKYQGSRGLTQTRWGTESRPFSDILNRLCNNKSLTVQVEVDGQRYTDIDRTAEAEAKAEEIKEEWADWLFADRARRDLLTERYNETFNNYVPLNVDGSVLVDENGLLPRQSPLITLEQHQLDAVYRGVLEGNLLCDMSVGTGKTFTAIAIIMELRRMKLLDGGKAMVVVPNHLVAQWRSEAARLYPGARVIVAEQRDLEKLNRRRFFGVVAANDADMIILPMSAFKFLEPPPDFLAAVIKDELLELQFALSQLSESNRRAQRAITQRKKTLKNKLERLLKRPRRDTALTFDDLGIGLLVHDEQHVNKNLAYSTNLTNVAGMGPVEGSQRAYDVWAKVRYLQTTQAGRGFISLTGSPIANSLVEMFTLFRFHAYDMLTETHLNWLDNWIRLYAAPSTTYELGVDGKYKLKTRLRSFHNVPELLRAYASIAHVVTKDDLKAQYRAAGKFWPEPEMTGGKPQLVICPRTAAQDAYFAEILERAENMREVDPSVDNWLKLTSDAMLASLDMRLHDPELPGDPGDKVSQVAREVLARYRKWNHVRGTQMIFADSGVPNADADRFCVYDAIKHELMSHGIPANEIAYVHDAKTARQKVKLQRDINAGCIRVVIGSTERGGTGTNYQARLVAIHTLDCGWRPADMIQRLGRGLRQGNELYEADPNGFTLDVLWYATDRTLDAVRYATVEGKGRFIDQFRKGDVAERVINDIDDEVVSSFGEMKAKISGNPLIKLRHELERDINDLERRERTWRRTQHRAQSFIEDHANYLEVFNTRMQRHAADLATVEPYIEYPGFNAGGVEYSGDTLRDGLSESVHAALCKPEWQLVNGVSLGKYCGLDLEIAVYKREVGFTLSGKDLDETTWFKKGKSITVTGLLMRLDNLLDKLITREEDHKAWRNYVAEELAVYAEELKKPFLRGDELVRKRELIRVVDKVLAEQKTEIPEDKRYLLAGLNDAPETVVPAKQAEPAIAQFAMPGKVAFALPMGA